MLNGEIVNELDKILDILENDNVFLTGGGGVGKSYLTSKIIAKYKKNHHQVVVLGSTGISAVQVGGQTLHSFFCFGITNNTDELKRYDKRQTKKLKQLNTILSKCSLLVIDEISMVSSWLLDMIRFRLVSGGFKGRLLLVGDFFQLPPVNKNQQNSFLNESIYAFSSSAWEYFDLKIALLTVPKRTQNEDFFSILNKIRVGDVDEKTLIFLERLSSQEEVLAQNPTVLFGRNKEANEMNKKRLYELESELFMFFAQTDLIDESLHVNKFQAWKNALNVDECLEIKIGANVLFCTNKLGSYFNGQRGVVVGINEDTIDVEKSNGRIVHVERHEYSLSEIISLNDEPTEVVLATIKQFPLRLAYAITIHKSQGMSIEKLACNIDNIFEKSQFYVALSRATDPDNLYLYYSRDDFDEHIKRCVKVDEDVVRFYENCDKIYIEDEK